jgi:chromosome segregation ATPase
MNKLFHWCLEQLQSPDSNIRLAAYGVAITLIFSIYPYVLMPLSKLIGNKIKKSRNSGAMRKELKRNVYTQLAKLINSMEATRERLFVSYSPAYIKSMKQSLGDIRTRIDTNRKKAPESSQKLLEAQKSLNDEYRKVAEVLNTKIRLIENASESIEVYEDRKNAAEQYRTEAKEILSDFDELVKIKKTEIKRLKKEFESIQEEFNYCSESIESTQKLEDEKLETNLLELNLGIEKFVLGLNDIPELKLLSSDQVLSQLQTVRVSAHTLRLFLLDLYGTSSSKYRCMILYYQNK